MKEEVLGDEYGKGRKLFGCKLMVNSKAMELMVVERFWGFLRIEGGEYDG